MFLLRKLKKWIELEISELKILEEDWMKREGCEYNVYACQQHIHALEGVLYIIKNKSVWSEDREHGIFKHK